MRLYKSHIALAVLSTLVASLAHAEPQATDDEVPAAPAPDAPTHVEPEKDERLVSERAFPSSTVDLSFTKHQSADLGELLSRSPGLNVRRRGGLGSDVGLSLYGVGGDAVRVLWNDIPLELAGYSQAVADLPLFQLERVDVYRGVVPLRLGIDAREGALNVIAPLPTRPYGAEAYYQIGSFGTHRAGVSGHYRHEPTGFFARASLYGDLARNDYDVTVLEPDDNGVARTAERELFHNRYRAAGADVEVGVLGRAWAERLTLRAFMQRIDRDIQADPAFAIPYGEVRTETVNRGVQARFQNTYRGKLHLEAIAGYTQISNTNFDESEWTYGWDGERRARIGRDGDTGESQGAYASGGRHRYETYARGTLSWRLDAANALQLSLTPRYSFSPAPGVETSMVSLVGGLGHLLTLLEGRLENSLFGKVYFASASSSSLEPFGTRAFDRKLHRFGVGDALRFRIADPLQARLSYELATRIPSMLELVGSGGPLIGNRELRAESSHNVNLELLVAQDTPAGSFRAGVNGFARKVDGEIVALSGTGFVTLANLADSRALGAEVRAGWSAPRDWLVLDANLTYTNARATSREGAFAPYEGQRIPSRPYLLANVVARSFWRDLVTARDELSFSYYFRAVGSYPRSWEGAGSAQFAIAYRAVQLHSVAVTYLFPLGDTRLGATLEADNLGDARQYGLYGAQLPGRALYLKLDFVL